jgi:hypothetical protein
MVSWLQLLWWLVCIGHMAETYNEFTWKYSLSGDLKLHFEDCIYIYIYICVCVCVCIHSVNHAIGCSDTILCVNSIYIRTQEFLINLCLFLWFVLRHYPCLYYIAFNGGMIGER